MDTTPRSSSTAEAAPTILAVDDQAGQRVILDMLLTLDGYQVVALEDGHAALAYLRDHTPRLAILDIGMPHMSGIEVCSRMKRISRLSRVPVIILTGQRDERVLAEARLAKADRVVLKPLEGKDLRSVVRELVAESE